MDYMQFLIIALGIYGIFRGIRILTTGKLPEREEARLGDLTENGLRRYKMLSAMMNIVAGVIVIGIGIGRILNLFDPDLFKIIALAALVILVVVFVVIRNSCKNVK